MAAPELARRLADICPRHDVDLAGAVPLAGPAPHAAAWFAWLDRGFHGGLSYLARDPRERADPRRRAPGAHSLLVFAQRYTDGWPPHDEAPGDWLPRVARYARGQDYHEVLFGSVRGVLSDLQAIWPDLVAAPAVDTGPFLERDWAAHAGLGFVGQNTCLIHERLGSGLVLAVAPANLRLLDLAAAPKPLYAIAPRPVLSDRQANRCGRCTRCLDACPTGALTAPFMLDAGRCLSTWTIERQGRTPAAARRAQGERLFGCDVCQQVCPWNLKAARRAAAPQIPPPPAAYAPLAQHAELDLKALITLTAADFRQRFRATPLWRAHPQGLRRNALVVAANTGRADLLDVIRRVAAADGDPDVRAVAAWAAAWIKERS